MVLAPMSSVIKGAIQSLSPMVAFFLDCVEPLVPLRSGLMPAVLPYHRHLC